MPKGYETEQLRGRRVRGLLNRYQAHIKAGRTRQAAQIAHQLELYGHTVEAPKPARKPKPATQPKTDSGQQTKPAKPATQPKHDSGQQTKPATGKKPKASDTPPDGGSDGKEPAADA